MNKQSKVQAQTLETGSTYIARLDKSIKDYFEVLEPDYPEWLNEYINTPELLKQQYISITCGTIYSDLFDSNFFYSSLDHSVGVALIVWHFTHDKKQTLSGLFHDIATPVFKHCIDFMNGDYISQESTEELTHQIIADSKELTRLLKRDHIQLSEVDDYHKYPIADNDTPRLSADRLEYSLANALFTYRVGSLDEVKRFYNNLQISKNEDGVEELAFKTKKVAQDFVQLTCKLSSIYMADKTRYSMQLLADIIKKLNEAQLITKADLYNLKESEVISIIRKSQYGEIYDKWKHARDVSVSKERPEGVYSVNHKIKIRYIDPITEGKRVSEICEASRDLIRQNLSYDMNRYVYLDLVL